MTGTIAGALKQRAHLLLIMLTAVTISIAAIGCPATTPDQLNPTPDFGNDTPLDASEIWQEYQGAGSNRFANDTYKNRWAVIYIDGVRKDADNEPAGIDAVAGSRIIVRTPGTVAQMEFNFRFVEEANEYSRGDTPVVLCNIAGTDLSGSKLTFNHCRPHE